MPIIPLPSHETIKLPKSSDHHPYVVHDPCQGEGQFELNRGPRIDIAPGGNISFTFTEPGVITNTGNVELTVRTTGD